MKRATTTFCLTRVTHGAPLEPLAAVGRADRAALAAGATAAVRSRGDRPLDLAGLDRAGGGLLVELLRPASEHRGPERDQLPLHARCLKPPIWTRRRQAHQSTRNVEQAHSGSRTGARGWQRSRKRAGRNGATMMSKSLHAGARRVDGRADSHRLPPGRGVSGRRVQHAHRGSADWRGRCHSAAVAVGGGARWSIHGHDNKGSEGGLSPSRVAKCPAPRCKRGAIQVGTVRARACRVCVGVWLGWGCFLGDDIYRKKSTHRRQRWAKLRHYPPH